MAVASLVSRITGFLRQLALVAVLGVGVVNDSYNVANTLPNIVYELLLGGVLTSVMSRCWSARRPRTRDGGEAYTQRLLTLAGVALALAPCVAMAAAPLLPGSPRRRQRAGDPQLATVFAGCCCRRCFFYGLGALLGALLNTRGVFGPFAWAPVLNNVVVLAVLASSWRCPAGSASTRCGWATPKLLVLGVGHDARHRRPGARAAAAVRRTGFRSARCGAGTGGSARPAAWPCGSSAYVLIGQAGLRRHHPRRGRCRAG